MLNKRHTDKDVLEAPLRLCDGRSRGTPRRGMLQRWREARGPDDNTSEGGGDCDSPRP